MIYSLILAAALGLFVCGTNWTMQIPKADASQSKITSAEQDSEAKKQQQASLAYRASTYMFLLRRLQDHKSAPDATNTNLENLHSPLPSIQEEQ